jgi:Bucentaur or craniofacial development
MPPIEDPRDEMEEDDYDEDADSDFDAKSAVSGDLTSSSDEEEDTQDADAQASARSQKRRKIQNTKPPIVEDLDSGDEATIQEHKKTPRKSPQKGGDAIQESADESEGWRARTRTMREKEKEDKKRNKLASTKSSTIDVNKLWEEMNSPDFMLSASLNDQARPPLEETEASQTKAPVDFDKGQDPANKENDPGEIDMITIKRTYKFAGEVHTEEKVVPRASAEARLWLAQQQSKPQAIDAEGRVLHRPMRKISRFDPNFSNLASFKAAWTATRRNLKEPSGPKLNVVEKSKMDWAVHVDAEGLKDELDEHAKAKEGYLNRMDFLRDVEERREVEARTARLQRQ